jgi:hypothetical protein
VTCGNNGQQTRRRVIAQPAIGSGKACDLSSETRNCMPAPAPCPVPCVHSFWSTWSSCSGTCSPALRQRVLTISAQPMFGGTACPPPKETDDCSTVLPRCPDIPTPRPTPSPVLPTPAPTVAPTAPPATAPPANVAASFVNPFAPTKELKVETILLLGVNTENAQASNTLLTWANGSLGVRDAASNSDGVLAHPFSLQIQFASRRAIKAIKFSQWDPTDEATLVAVNRNERRRADPLFVPISDPNADLFAQTASGFDTFEVRPAKGSSFAIVSFESPLPDSSNAATSLASVTSDATTRGGNVSFESPLPDSTTRGGNDGTTEVTSPSTASSRSVTGVAPSSDGPEPWLIGAIIGGAVFVTIVVGLAIYFFFKRRHAQQSPAEDVIELKQPPGSVVVGAGTSDHGLLRDAAASTIAGNEYAQFNANKPKSSNYAANTAEFKAGVLQESNYGLIRDTDHYAKSTAEFKMSVSQAPNYAEINDADLK